MVEKQLMSFAIINVNEKSNVDQFDNFVPFAKEALLRSGIETISANELRDKINEYFKISLPISVVNTILKRKLFPKGYVKKERHIFVPNYEKLRDSNFQEIKQKIMERHEKLIDDIIKYGNTNYQFIIKVDEAEKALELFLEKHQLALLDSSLNPSSYSYHIRTEDRKENQLEYVISKFIDHAYTSASLSFDYIIDIVKGTMLTNALYYRDDVTTINMKFKSTEIYFDSTFLIYALGYAGQARQEPCSELIEMLRSNNAILKVFRHNIEEIVGILEYCKNNLTKGVHDPHGTITNFLDKRYSESDIDRIIFGIENELKDKFRIRIVESVDYDDHSFVISHEELHEKLKRNLTYRREIARERDVESVSAIIRLRRRERPLHVEKSRALFVTNNFKFSRVVKEYFFDEDNSKTIPPVLHDSTLTNIMWLKNPSKTPNLPRKRIIAQTFAATQPPEHLWNRYLETINIYEDKFTEEEFIFLNYSTSAREMLMDLTMGDEDVISIGTITEILDERDSREQQRIEEVRKAEEQTKKVLQAELEQNAAVFNFQENKVISIAKRRAKRTTNLIFGCIALTLGVLVYVSNFDWIRNNHPIIHSAIILFLILPTLMGLFGKSITPWKRKIEAKLQNKYEEKIRTTYYAKEDIS